MAVLNLACARGLCYPSTCFVIVEHGDLLSMQITFWLPGENRSIIRNCIFTVRERRETLHMYPGSSFRWWRSDQTLLTGSVNFKWLYWTILAQTGKWAHGFRDTETIFQFSFRTFLSQWPSQAQTGTVTPSHHGIFAMPCAKLENESRYYFFFRKLPIARSILNYLYAFKEPGNLMMRSGETHKTLPAVMFQTKKSRLKDTPRSL